MNDIQKAKEVLTNAGYFVDNLWRIEDVQDIYECTDEDALHVLDDALTSEYIVQNVFDIISIVCKDYEFKPK